MKINVVFAKQGNLVLRLGDLLLLYQKGTLTGIQKEDGSVLTCMTKVANVSKYFSSNTNIEKVSSSALLSYLERRILGGL